MKKIIGFILLCTIAFFNIDNVEAELSFLSNIDGTCSLTNSSENLCEYHCKIDSETMDKYGANSYLYFDFSVRMDNSGLLYDIDNVVADGNGFVIEPDAGSTWRKKYSQVLKSDYARDIMSKSPINYIVSTNYSDVDADWKGNYKSDFTKLVTFPDTTYLLKNSGLVCRKIITRGTVKYENSAGGWAYVHNEVDIFSDPEQLKQDLEEQAANNNTNYACGLLGEKDSKTIIFIKKIYNLIKIIIPILIIFLSIFDFIKVIGVGKDDDMKKAINKFIKRIIIAIIFVLVPLIVQMLINISGISEQYSGLGTGIDAIFCILG